MLAGLFIILFGLVQLVIYLGVIYWLAYFVVGGAIAVIGAIALYVALNRLSTDNLMPKQSIDQLGKDAGVVKEQVK